jgi:RNA polymerase sigma-70 factor (ECF subfamily)
VSLGDEEALQQLHRRYAPLVMHLAARALGRAAAEEVVQDTFLAVWRKAAGFDPAKGSVRTWLLSIGHHRMLDELRSRSRRPQGSEDPALDPALLSAEELLPDEALWREVQREAVSGALAALPEPQRAALRLAFFADLTHEEVARALKVPLGTAKTRIRSALRRLEQHLGSLVATLVVIGGGAWLWLHQARDTRTDRALHLLADSQTRALRLTPGDTGLAVEAGRHAVLRGAPGAPLAVLTLSHFPAPAPGERLVLWAQTARGWHSQPLQPPDAQGQSLQLLDTPWMAQGWPLALRITREIGPSTRPSESMVVGWTPAGDKPSPGP